MNKEGEFVYVESKLVGEGSVLQAEAKVMRNGLKYCIVNSFIPVTMKTDSLILKKVMDHSLQIPWNISLDIRRINELRK